MGTQLILTVGTNPLPVWVAWYHLKDQLDQPIQVRLVHTSDTANEKDRLMEYCHGADFLDPIETSPGDPGKVRQSVAVVLDNLDGITHLHAHYTGGTKVMAVETVAALEYKLPCNVELETSYLDPHGVSGPAIVDSYGRHLRPSDARENIPADLSHVARLNGFRLGSFDHEYWADNQGGFVKKTCPAPAILDNKQQQTGKNILDRMETDHPSRIRPRFFEFEYAAYVAVKEALEKIAARNPIRNNYELFHSVNVQRTEAKQRDPYFELDVVALLGYQIVVVSCTLETGRAPIKEKGMEVILRARQLGGDEAQAIVLCKAHADIAQQIEKELHDEVGSTDTPLQVWGTDRWRNLSDVFYRYLRNDLHWM